MEIPSTIATALGGGIGRRGEVCGAVIGAALIIGIWGKRKLPEEKVIYDSVHGKMQDLMAAFEKEMGTLICRELTGYDLRIQEEFQEFCADGNRRRKCEHAVAVAGWLLGKVICGNKDNYALNRNKQTHC